MRLRFPALLFCFAGLCFAQTETVGDWKGTLQVGSVQLRLVFHLTRSDGALRATLDSLDQAAFRIPVDSVKQDGASLHMEMAKMKATYDGEWDAAGGRFRGQFTQNGLAIPLELTRGDASGAKAAQPLSREDREFLLAYLERTRAAYATAIAGLTPSQWQYKPDTDRWSIAECAEHLVIAERDMLKAITQQIAKVPIPEGVARNGRAEDEKVIAAMTDRSKKVTAAESERPKGIYATPADASRDFTAARAATVAYANSTQDDLRGHGVRDGKGGFSDAYELLLTMSGHTARHVAQMEEVKAAKGYPK